MAMRVGARRDHLSSACGGSYDGFGVDSAVFYVLGGKGLMKVIGLWPLLSCCTLAVSDEPFSTPVQQLGMRGVKQPAAKLCGVCKRELVPH